jgi:hypothetical protein
LPQKNPSRTLGEFLGAGAAGIVSATSLYYEPIRNYIKSENTPLIIHALILLGYCSFIIASSEIVGRYYEQKIKIS